MATFVNDLRLKEIATGDESGTWGTSTNVNLELIGEAMGLGAETIPNASTHTITMADGTSDEFRSLFLRLTGGGTACTVTLAPNTLSHTWIMRNETSAALTLTQGSGANVTIAAGQTKIVATDGGGSGAIVYEMDDLELAGNLTVDTTTLVVDATNNRVGIGTSSPLQALHVNSGTGNSAAIFESTDSTSQIWIKDSASSSTYQTGIACFGDNLLFNNGGERLRIDSSGNVGIGTSSPSATLALDKNTTTQHRVLDLENNSITYSMYVDQDNSSTNSWSLFDTTNSQTALRYLPSSSGYWQFYTNNAERMRIDASGNLALNSNGSVASLDGVAGMQIGNSSAGSAGVALETSNRGYLMYINGTSLAFWDSSNNSNRMVIDASGNLLVGKTTAAFGTAGVELKPSGETYVTRASATPLYVRRNTDDGDIVQFWKDGSPVGSIGTGSGLLTIGTGTGNLVFENALVAPCSDSSVGSSNGVVDLGTSSRRFKDLHLSGHANFTTAYAATGIYLGAYASPNLLDDYEEGTWTLGLNTSNSDATISSVNTTGYYTKIGNLVTVNIYNAGANITVAGSGSAYITGLPFTVANGNGYYSTVTFSHTNMCTTQIDAYAAVNTTFCVVLQVGTITNAVFAIGNPKYMMMSLTYMTSQ